MRLRVPTPVVACLASLLVLGGCQQSAEATTHITGAGSSFAAPMFNKWFEVYAQDHADLSLSYDSVGSGEGIDRFLAGTLDRWDDPRIAAANPGIELPHKLIQVVARQDSSGTTFAFTNHLAAISDQWDAGIGKLIDWPGGTMLARGNGNEGVAGRMRIIGHYGTEVSKRVDIFAAALHHGMTVEDLSDLDLSYTPPLSSPWDPVQMAAQSWVMAWREAGGDA